MSNYVYVGLIYNGDRLILEPQEAIGLIRSAEDEDVITDLTLALKTKEEYEAIPEYQGP